MIKKLFANSVIYGIAPQIPTIAGIFALPFITAHLTAFDYGVWGIITAYSTALSTLAHLGMGIVLVNSFYKMPSQFKWHWRQIYGFLIAWSVPYALILGSFLFFIIPESCDNNRFLIIFLVAAPLVLFGPTSMIGQLFYQLHQKPIPIAIRTIIFGLMTIGLQLFTISYLKLGYMGWAWSIFIVSILSNASYWYILNVKKNFRPIFNFKWYRIKKDFKISAPTILHNYTPFLLNGSNRIVMERMNIKTTEIGEYNLAQNFGNYFSSISSAVNKAISPMLANAYKNKDYLTARSLIFVFSVTLIAITFNFCIWSKEILNLLIKNDELKLVYPLCIILIMAYNFRPMYIASVNRLMYDEKTKYLWRISLVAGFINVILSIVFIHFFGYKFIPYAFYLSMIYMSMYGHFSNKTKSINEYPYYPIFWLVLIILLTIFSSVIVEWNMQYKIYISLFSLVIFLISLIKLSKTLRNAKVN